MPPVSRRLASPSAFPSPPRPFFPSFSHVPQCHPSPRSAASVSLQAESHPAGGASLLARHGADGLGESLRVAGAIQRRHADSHLHPLPDRRGDSLGCALPRPAGGGHLLSGGCV